MRKFALLIFLAPMAGLGQSLVTVAPEACLQRRHRRQHDPLHALVERRPGIDRRLACRIQRRAVRPLQVDVLQVDDQQREPAALQLGIRRLGRVAVIQRAQGALPGARGWRRQG